MVRRKIFIDLDGVLADFDKACKLSGLDHNIFKNIEGVFIAFEPMPSAIENVRKLFNMENELGIELWIASKPPADNCSSYSEKAEWVHKYLPELKDRIILTQNKGLLGNENDFLIDDYPQGSKCNEFSGTLIHFGKDCKDWNDLLPKLINTLSNPKRNYFKSSPTLDELIYLLNKSVT